MSVGENKLYIRGGFVKEVCCIGGSEIKIFLRTARNLGQFTSLIRRRKYYTE